MTQEELDNTYLNKWVIISKYEIEREILVPDYQWEFDKYVYKGDKYETRVVSEDTPIEGVAKCIDLYDEYGYSFIEIDLFIPYDGKYRIITFIDNIQVDILKTLKRKKQYIRSKKHARISK